MPARGTACTGGVRDAGCAVNKAPLPSSGRFSTHLATSAANVVRIVDSNRISVFATRYIVRAGDSSSNSSGGWSGSAADRCNLAAVAGVAYAGDLHDT